MANRVMRYRLDFQRRSLDANGQPLGEWASIGELWAEIGYLRGSETAITNRLIGKQPVKIEVRDTPVSRRVEIGVRAVVTGVGPRAGEEFNIRSIAPAKQFGFFNLIADSGGPDG